MTRNLESTEAALKVVFLRTFRESLEQNERAAQAFASLLNLDPETAEAVAISAVEHLRAGPPLPTFLSVMDDAQFWADLASPSELDAYCLASFNRMGPVRQAQFLEHVQDRRVA